MKAIKSILLSLRYAILFMFSFSAKGQTTSINPSILELGRVEPYAIEVTYNMTTHLVFPSAIRYVDYGSELLMMEKAPSIENVLRVKALVRDFQDETNFTVITADGSLYSFNVQYASCPESTNYDVLTMQKNLARRIEKSVQFEDLGSTPPSLAGQIMTTIYKKDKRIIRHIAAKSFGIRFQIKGIYIHNGKYYFNSEIRNSSNIAFNVDFVTFKVINKNASKRTISQQRMVNPTRIFKTDEEALEHCTSNNVYMLNQFTLSEGTVLEVELFEKNGGRHQVLRIENADLVNAHKISRLHLKFND